MKKSIILFIALLFFFPLFEGCKKGTKAPAEEVIRESVEPVVDTVDFLLTENEVRAFIKAYPVFIETINEKGRMFEEYDKNLLKTTEKGEQVSESEEKLNKVLKPYGFDLKSFMVTYGKITEAYSHTTMIDAQEIAERNIKEMKRLLEKPYISAEQKEEMRKIIKEIEKEKDIEKNQIYKKNTVIVQKHKDKLEKIFK